MLTTIVVERNIKHAVNEHGGITDFQWATITPTIAMEYFRSPKSQCPKLIARMKESMTQPASGLRRAMLRWCRKHRLQLAEPRARDLRARRLHVKVFLRDQGKQNNSLKRDARDIGHALASMLLGKVFVTLDKRFGRAYQAELESKGVSIKVLPNTVWEDSFRDD